MSGEETRGGPARGKAGGGGRGAREERLAANLRANLHRRKAQARARDAASDGIAAPDGVESAGEGAAGAADTGENREKPPQN